MLIPISKELSAFQKKGDRLLSQKRVTRFERATSTLARLRSTTELYPQQIFSLKN